MTAIEDYWFGVHGDTFPANYPASVVTMVWGGKGANATWFSADPQTVHGINWLPITGASLYLGRFPEYCAKNYAALKTEHHDFVLKEAAKKHLPIPSDETPWNGWTDLTWMYRSLSDPSDAKAQYSAGIANGQKQNFETGHSEAALGHWIQTLASVGTVDRGVTADTALYAVFSNQSQRTHAAYNSGSKARVVKFSDGIELSIPAGSWGVKTSAK
jgi:endoglucanase Acf2